MPSKLGVVKVSSITPMFIKIGDQIKNEDEKDTQDKNKGINFFTYIELHCLEELHFEFWICFIFVLIAFLYFLINKIFKKIFKYYEMVDQFH